MEYLTNLPTEILSYRIFPALSLTEIEKLNQVSDKFNKIGKNDTLWELKTIAEFSQYDIHKSLDISWKDYYRLLIRGKMIQVYSQADHIFNIPFNLNMLGVTIYMIKSYISMIQYNGIIHIKFIHNRRQIYCFRNYSGPLNECVTTWCGNMNLDSLDSIEALIKSHNVTPCTITLMVTTIK